MRIDTLPRDTVQSYLIPEPLSMQLISWRSVLTVLQMAEPVFPAASYHVRVYHELQDLGIFLHGRELKACAV